MIPMDWFPLMLSRDKEPLPIVMFPVMNCLMYVRIIQQMMSVSLALRITLSLVVPTLSLLPANIGLIASIK